MAAPAPLKRNPPPRRPPPNGGARKRTPAFGPDPPRGRPLYTLGPPDALPLVDYRGRAVAGNLPERVPQEAVDRLLEVAREGLEISVNLEQQTVTTPYQDRFTFEIDPFRKHCLLNGLDEVGLTMARGEAIGSFEASRTAAQPWLMRGTDAA